MLQQGSVHVRVMVAAAIAASLTGLATGCGSVGQTNGSASPTSVAYAPKIDPTDFSTTIDNPYMPLQAGTRSVYEGSTPDGRQRTVMEVTHETRKIMGVTTITVHDSVTLDGRPSEDTLDWYAQDRKGNVWYFGEATKKTDAGGAVSTKGSFVAGVDGALPGIVMEAHPKVGDSYRQEYYKGIAEDRADVLSTSESATVAAGSYRDLVMTKDYNPLDPSASIEHKYFARTVGLILVVHVTGPAERVELVKVESV
jgi:hypothetical protein